MVALSAPPPCASAATPASARLLAAAAEHSLRVLLPHNAVFLAERLVSLHQSSAAAPSAPAAAPTAPAPAPAVAGDAAARELLARAHLACGRPERAAAALRPVARGPAAPPDARYLYAAACAALATDAALAEAEAALRGRPEPIDQSSPPHQHQATQPTTGSGGGEGSGSGSGSGSGGSAGSGGSGRSVSASAVAAAAQTGAASIPGGAAGLHLLATICHRTARKDEAIRLYRRALVLCPTLWVAAEALAALGVVSSASAVVGAHDDVAALALLSAQPQFAEASRPIAAADRTFPECDARTGVPSLHQLGICAQSEALADTHPLMQAPPQADVPHAHAQARHSQDPADRACVSAAPSPAPVSHNAVPQAAHPSTPAQPSPRRPRGIRYTTPSPVAQSSAATPAPPGAPGRRTFDRDSRRTGRLFSTPDGRDASAVSRILGSASHSHVTPQASTPQHANHRVQTPQRHHLLSSRQSNRQSQVHGVQHMQIDTDPARSLAPSSNIGGPQTPKGTDTPGDIGNHQDCQIGTSVGATAMDIIRHMLHAAGALGSYRCAAAVRIASELPACHRDTGYILGIVGRARLELGDYAGAETAFAKSLAIEPTRLNGIVEYYSTVLWHMKKETELAELAIHSFNTDRQTVATWCAVGNCYSLQRDPDTALRYFKRATRVDPANAYAHTLAGHEYVVKEDFDSALASYRQAILLDERHYNALYGIGQVLQKQEKFSLAERHFRTALHLHPRNSNLHYHLGVALAASATAAAATSSSSTVANAEGVRVQSSRTALLPALKELEEAAVLDGRNPVPKFERAKILAQMGRLADARAQLESLRDALPREAAVYHELGRVCKRMGDHKTALRCFNYALDIDHKDQGRRYKKAIDTLYSNADGDDS